MSSRASFQVGRAPLPLVMAWVSALWPMQAAIPSFRNSLTPGWQKSPREDSSLACTHLAAWAAALGCGLGQRGRLPCRQRRPRHPCLRAPGGPVAPAGLPRAGPHPTQLAVSDPPCRRGSWAHWRQAEEVRVQGWRTHGRARALSLAALADSSTEPHLDRFASSSAASRWSLRMDRWYLSTRACCRSSQGDRGLSYLAAPTPSDPPGIANPPLTISIS